MLALDGDSLNRFQEGRFLAAKSLYQPVNCNRIIQNISNPNENNCGRNNRISGICTVCGSSRGNPLVNAEPARK